MQGHDVWLTQKAIGQLFDVNRRVVTKHLKNIYDSGEVSENSTCANFAQTQVADNGKTDPYKFYSGSAIIAVGYRANSSRAAQLRQWATRLLEANLPFNDAEILQDKGRVTAAIAIAFAESEFEQYRISQDPSRVFPRRLPNNTALSG